MIAKTDKGNLIPIGKKEYWEIGYDLDGNQRMGSWQIKEIMDLSLQPKRKTAEKFLKELPEGTKSVDIEVKLAMWPSPKTELIVHTLIKKLDFEK